MPLPHRSLRSLRTRLRRSCAWRSRGTRPPSLRVRNARSSAASTTTASPGSRFTMNDTMQSSHASVPAITQSPQSIVSVSPVAMVGSCSPGETLSSRGAVMAAACTWGGGGRRVGPWAWALAVDEGPVVAGLEVVVVLAQRVELVDPCAFRFDPLEPVVVLQSLRARCSPTPCTPRIATTARPVGPRSPTGPDG